MKTLITYWTLTGNTEKMAIAILEAMQKDTDIKKIAEIKPADLVNYDLVLMGCPAKGAEELEPEEFQPFYDEAKELIKGKKVGLFGSFDWGDGEWMDTWKTDAEEAGLEVVDTYIVQQDEIDDIDPSAFVENLKK